MQETPMPLEPLLIRKDTAVKLGCLPLQWRANGNAVYPGVPFVLVAGFDGAVIGPPVWYYWPIIDDYQKEQT